MSKITIIIVLLLSICCTVSFGAKNLDDFWVGNASWVLDSTGIGSSFNMHFPSMLWVNNEIWAYYIKHEKNAYGEIIGFGVGRARSTNGTSWTDDGFVLNTGGEIEWGFEGNSDFYHQIGRAVGSAWSADTALDNTGYLCYGPYTTAIRSGPMDVKFGLMIDNNTADNEIVVQLDVYDVTSSTVLASKNIRRKDFTSTRQYNRNNLNFYVTCTNHTIEFRT